MALRKRAARRAVRTADKVRAEHTQQESHGQDIPGHQPGLSVSENNVQSPLSEAQRLAREGKLVEAWELAEHHLTYVDPNSPSALTIGLDVWRKQNNPAVAYQFARRCTELYPNDSTAWSNLGMIADTLYRFDEAEQCFNRAVHRARDGRDKASAWLNWACMLVNKGDWAVAEGMARKALAANPESPKAAANLGLACLALGKWREGWPLYDAVIGFDNSRRKNQYKDEPVWDGSPGKRVVIYGEQGLGDEISFASMIPDALKVCRSVVIDCTDRLAPLFQRSFPKARVYGTRWEK